MILKVEIEIMEQTALQKQLTKENEDNKISTLDALKEDRSLWTMRDERLSLKTNW